MIALSVSQPYAELIMRGTKRIEYRKISTIKRERVYIFAKTFPGPASAYSRLGLRPQDLPGGVLLGTIEVIGCTQIPSGFEWHLSNPQRLEQPLKPVRTPLPVWFYPFWPENAELSACR